LQTTANNSTTSTALLHNLGLSTHAAMNNSTSAAQAVVIEGKL